MAHVRRNFGATSRWRLLLFFSVSQSVVRSNVVLFRPDYTSFYSNQVKFKWLDYFRATNTRCKFSIFSPFVSTHTHTHHCLCAPFCVFFRPHSVNSVLGAHINVSKRMKRSTEKKGEREAWKTHKRRKVRDRVKEVEKEQHNNFSSSEP